MSIYCRMVTRGRVESEHLSSHRYIYSLEGDKISSLNITMRGPSADYSGIFRGNMSIARSHLVYVRVHTEARVLPSPQSTPSSVKSRPKHNSAKGYHGTHSFCSWRLNYLHNTGSLHGDALKPRNVEHDPWISPSDAPDAPARHCRGWSSIVGWINRCNATHKRLIAF